MGRGNSSDVYDLRISKPKGRTILVTITPTSSGSAPISLIFYHVTHASMFYSLHQGSITLPMVGGEGSLIVGFLWELIPYAIRYRKDLTSVSNYIYLYYLKKVGSFSIVILIVPFRKKAHSG